MEFNDEILSVCVRVCVREFLCCTLDDCAFL